MTNLKAGDRIIDHYVYKPSKTSDPVCMGTEGVITEISKYGAIYYETIHGKKGVAHPKQCELINKEEDADNYSSTPSDNQLKVGQVISVFDQAEHFIAKVDEFWDDGTVIVTRCVPRKNTKDVVAVHPKQCMPCKWEIEDNGEESEENKDHIPDTGKKVEWCECIGALVFNIKTKIHETCGKPIKHIRDLGTILNNLASGTTSINEIKTKESHARVDNVLRDGKIFQQGRRIEELGNIAESHKSCLHDSLKRFVVLEEKYNALHQEVEKLKAARTVEKHEERFKHLEDFERFVMDSWPKIDDLLANQKHIDAELLSLRRLFKADKTNSDVCPNCNGTQYADLSPCGFCIGSGVVKVS